MEFLVVRAAEITVIIGFEVRRTERIIAVSFILRFFLVHGKFHKFFHSVLLAVEVVVVRSVTGICDGVFGVKTIQRLELLHKRNKAVHIRTVLHHIYDSDIFICDPDLNIVRRQELIIAHIIPFHAHKGGIVICF